MFNTNYLVDIIEFDTNCHDIIETYQNVRHPFDCGGCEAEELQMEDIREQKRMMFQNVLPLRS